MGFDFLLSISPFHGFCNHSRWSLHTRKKKIQKSFRHLCFLLIPPFSFPSVYPSASYPYPSATSDTWLLFSIYSVLFALKRAQEVLFQVENRSVPCRIRDGAQRAGQNRPRNQEFRFPLQRTPAQFYLWIIRDRPPWWLRIEPSKGESFLSPRSLPQSSLKSSLITQRQVPPLPILSHFIVFIDVSLSKIILLLYVFVWHIQYHCINNSLIA